MDLKRVEELIQLMDRSGVTELSLELPDYKISIKKSGANIATSHVPDVELAETPVGQAKEQVSKESRAANAREPAVNSTTAMGVPIVSPVVGVFHNGGMLDPRQLVREGDRVQEGQLIAAIEAMKVPNELRAPVSGLVTRLLVEDGKAVEYGQTLLLIEPDQGDETSEGETPIGLV